jgi:type II secretory pathway component PulF
MLYNYKVRTAQGEDSTGTIEAVSNEAALSSLQSRNMIVISLEAADSSGAWYEKSLNIFERVKARDVVIISRQLSTLFEAKVPVVDSLKVIIAETTSPLLRKHISEILEDIQGGTSISGSLAKHPEVFSTFYVSMVRAGEESGKLDEVFLYLADYLERSYDLATKAKNAMIYPAFVMFAFFGVMIVMLTVVVPRLSAILLESGQNVPMYTKVVIAFSDFVRRFGILLVFASMGGGFALWRYTLTETGKMAVARLQISLPAVGELYRKLYLARMADNLQTLLSGGVSIVRALEITADVVGNPVYIAIIKDATEAVKAGNPISASLARYSEIPLLVSQSIRIGEETGKLDFILMTLARFYRREVDSAVDNLVGLIEPVMILVLGLGVGILVAAILVPIYNISTSF